MVRLDRHRAKVFTGSRRNLNDVSRGNRPRAIIKRTDVTVRGGERCEH